MNHGEAQAAIGTFSEIIRRKPEFAEGWNKRATIYFLIGEYDKSLQDCDEVIKRNPQHWGALSGYGQIYVQLDKPEEALVYFQRALVVNPNLQQVERMIEQLKQIVIEKRKGTI
jgi:tetratricopeptide (TPR) repeat protein